MKTGSWLWLGNRRPRIWLAIVHDSRSLHDPFLTERLLYRGVARSDLDTDLGEDGLTGNPWPSPRDTGSPPDFSVDLLVGPGEIR